MTNKELRRLQRISNQDLIDYGYCEYGIEEHDFEGINWETLPARRNKQIILSRLSDIQDCISDSSEPFFLEEEL